MIKRGLCVVDSQKSGGNISCYSPSKYIWPITHHLLMDSIHVLLIIYSILPSSMLWQSWSPLLSVGMAPFWRWFPVMRWMEKWSEHIVEFFAGVQPFFCVNFIHSSRSSVFGKEKKKHFHSWCCSYILWQNKFSFYISSFTGLRAHTNCFTCWSSTLSAELLMCTDVLYCM